MGIFAKKKTNKEQKRKKGKERKLPDIICQSLYEFWYIKLILWNSHNSSIPIASPHKMTHLIIVNIMTQ